MARKRYPAEEIIGHLPTIEIETGKVLGIAEACRKLSITEQTYYGWKKEYGGLRSIRRSAERRSIFFWSEQSRKTNCFEAIE